MERTLTELIPVLQIAIGPVILISGVGLLLLSMTNRFGRIIDRSRSLVREVRSAQGAARERDQKQIHFLLRRARILRAAILLALVSVLAAAFLIILLFLFALLEVDAAWVITGVFVGCLGSLIGSLGCFIRDINLSLVALKMELHDHGERPA